MPNQPLSGRQLVEAAADDVDRSYIRDLIHVLRELIFGLLEWFK